MVGFEKSLYVHDELDWMTNGGLVLGCIVGSLGDFRERTNPL